MKKLIKSVDKELLFAVAVLIEARVNMEVAIAGFHCAEANVWGLKSKLENLKNGEPTTGEMIKPPKMHGTDKLDNYAGKGGA